MKDSRLNINTYWKRSIFLVHKHCKVEAYTKQKCFSKNISVISSSLCLFFSKQYSFHAVCSLLLLTGCSFMIWKDKVKEDVKPHVADQHWYKLKFSSKEAASMPLCKNLTLWTVTLLLMFWCYKTCWGSIKKVQRQACSLKLTALDIITF